MAGFLLSGTTGSVLIELAALTTGQKKGGVSQAPPKSHSICSPNPNGAGTSLCVCTFPLLCIDKAHSVAKSTGLTGVRILKQKVRTVTQEAEVADR